MSAGTKSRTSTKVSSLILSVQVRSADFERCHDNVALICLSGSMGNYGFDQGQVKRFREVLMSTQLMSTVWTLIPPRANCL